MLPARGGDPVVGLSRSFWYSAERDGLIRLVRIRRRGVSRGRTLLPVDAAVALIRRLDAERSDITPIPHLRRREKVGTRLRKNSAEGNAQ
jgi:hypothetical protein